jgi:hypothetical protein
MNERLNEITNELAGLFTELQSITARALPLVTELQAYGLELPPELNAMLATIQPRELVN